MKLLTTFGTLFASWYMSVLTQFPLITKSVTAAVIGLLGDTAAQVLEERLRARKDGGTVGPTRAGMLSNYDRRRGLAVLGDSILVSGPLLHFAYEVLEYLIPVTGPSASVAAMAQVLIDNFVLDSVFVGVLFVTTGIAEGFTTDQIKSQFRKDFFPAVRAGWATSLILLPLQFACFRFLPLHFRVLGVNVIDILWQGMISYMVHRRRKSMSKMVMTTTTDGAQPVSSSSPTPDYTHGLEQAA
jgi:peroxisomal membrane protein 2